jgi:hypothetical protein
MQHINTTEELISLTIKEKEELKKELEGKTKLIEHLSFELDIVKKERNEQIIQVQCLVNKEAHRPSVTSLVK